MYRKKNLIFLIIIILVSSFSYGTLKKIHTKYNAKIERLQNNYNKIVAKNKVDNEKFDEIKKFFLEENKFLNFQLSKNEIGALGNNEIRVKTFTNHILPFSGKRSSLENHENNLFILTGHGKLYYSNISNLSKDQIQYKKIETNLESLVNKDYLRKFNTIFKDIIIKNSKVYISFTNWNSKIKPFNPAADNCYFTSVVSGDFSLNKINFIDFFEMKECMPLFTNSAGSIMDKFKGNEILLTIGDYGSCSKLARNFAQEDNHLAGKIIKINEIDGSFKILSKGHRNQQGIFYDKSKNIIFITEHGPKGGDEININNLSKNQGNIKNYGWGSASYGEHYDTNPEYEKKITKACPLKKSHKENNFIEPIKYFVPSIAITQIIKENNFIKNNEVDDIIYFSSLGYTSKEGRRSFHRIELLNNKKIEVKKHDYFTISDRIRDMVYLKEIKKFILYLELTGSLAVISLEE